MGEGNLKRYFVYASGEILLVMIGILLALQVNNWNENQKKQATIKTYLENYIQDLREDKNGMEQLMNLNAFRYHALQYLLKTAGEEPYIRDNDEIIEPSDTIKPSRWQGAIPGEFDKKFFQIACLYSHRQRSSDLNLSTITELKSIGLYSYLGNQKLKESINTYYSEWHWRLGEQTAKLNSELIEKWQDSLADDGVITSNLFVVDDPLSLLKNYPKRLYLIRRLIREAGWIANGAQKVAQNADELIATVQEEIDSYTN